MHEALHFLLRAAAICTVAPPSERTAPLARRIVEGRRPWGWRSPCGAGEIRLDFGRGARTYAELVAEVRGILIFARRLTLDPLTASERQVAEAFLTHGRMLRVQPAEFEVHWWAGEPLQGRQEEIEAAPSPTTPQPQSEKEWHAWFYGRFMPLPERAAAVEFLRERVGRERLAAMLSEQAADPEGWALANGMTLFPEMASLLTEGGFGRPALFLNQFWLELAEEAVRP